MLIKSKRLSNECFSCGERVWEADIRFEKQASSHELWFGIN